MIFDHENLSIIKEFYLLKENENISLSELRNKIFKNLESPTQRNQKLRFIRDRLKLMPRDLFKIEKINGSIKYELVSDNIEIKQFNFPNGTKKGIALMFNEKWHIIEL